MENISLNDGEVAIDVAEITEAFQRIDINFITKDGNKDIAVGEIYSPIEGKMVPLRAPIQKAAIHKYWELKLEQVLSDLWKVMKFCKPEEVEMLVTTVMSIYINDMTLNGSVAGVGINMAHNHPTLQQNFMREVVIPFLKEEAGKEYADLRNEATHKMSVAMLKAVSENDYLPHV
jgi:hypothetical protein